MNKIIIEVSIGELLDKISILEIKQQKIKNPEKLRFIKDEYSILKDQLEKKINSKLWVIEDEKRLCEKEKKFDEKFIKLSREVHFLNDNRAKIKLEINNLTNSKIKEIKEYTNY